jgi:protein-S-isoprenylcysteine O-methyltransferase Ste14
MWSIEDLMHRSRKRFAVVQSSVIVAGFASVLLVNLVLAYKLQEGIEFTPWESFYIYWIGLLFFLLVIVGRTLAMITLGKKPDDD